MDIKHASAGLLHAQRHVSRSYWTARTVMVGRGSGWVRLQMVSPMLTSGKPVTAQMSPASTSSAGAREKLSYTNSSEILPPRSFSSAPHGSLISTHAGIGHAPSCIPQSGKYTPSLLCAFAM